MRHYLILKNIFYFLLYLVFIPIGCTEHHLEEILKVDKKIQVMITGDSSLIKFAYYVDDKIFYDDKQKINEILRILDYETKLIGLPLTKDFTLNYGQTLHILLARIDYKGTINLEIQGTDKDKYVLDRSEWQRHIMYKLRTPDKRKKNTLSN